MSTIEVIDLAGSFDDGGRSQRAVADEIGRACETAGFLMITGHGFQQDLIDELDGLSREFFDLPLDEKMRIAIGPSTHQRGYRFVGESNVAASIGHERPPDLREQFIAGPESVAGDAYYDQDGAAQFFQPNVWPAAPAGLQAAWEAYFAAGSRLAAHLMSLFAVTLQLPAWFFEAKIDRHISNLDAMHYPKQATPPIAGQLRSGAHTDFGSLTLLATDGTPGGLQVMLEGEWNDIVPVKGAFIVNLGDLMARWTNDRWRSRLHRVVNPPETVAASTRRLSLVYFHQPNFDVLIECLPSCLDSGEPPRYPPITSGHHLAQQLANIYVPTSSGGG